MATLTGRAAFPPLSSTYAMAVLLWLALVAFAVLGGADFGAGLWDLLALGRSADQVRGALIEAIGPIWEANEIWLIFLVTGLFTAFPSVFSTLSIALFVPAALALIGVVLRGAGFIYFSHFQREATVRRGWGSVFSLSSVIAPFFFGVMAGTVASGRIHIRDGVVVTGGQGYLTIWLAPFPLACGLYAIAICALLAAVYMTVEARNRGDLAVVKLFRRRAYYAYAATGLCGLLAGGLGAVDAPGVWGNLVTRALPLALATAALGIALLILLALGFYSLARVAVAGVVAGIMVTWGVAQFPYLIPPDLTLVNTASPPSVMGPLFVSSVVGMALILPALWLLFYLFKARHKPEPASTAEVYASALPTAEQKRASHAGLRSGTREAAETSWVDAIATVGLVTLGLFVVLSVLWRARRREPVAL